MTNNQPQPQEGELPLIIKNLLDEAYRLGPHKNWLEIEGKAVSKLTQLRAEDKGEITRLKAKLEFYREETRQIRELVLGSNEIGKPGQSLFDAVIDKINELTKNRENLIEYIYEFAWHYGRLYHIGDAEIIKSRIKEKFLLPEEWISEQPKQVAATITQLTKERDELRGKSEPFSFMDYDLTKLDKEGQDKVVNGFGEITGTFLMQLFYSLSLKSHLQWDMVDDTTGEKFVLSFKTVDSHESPTPDADIEGKVREILEDILWPTKEPLGLVIKGIPQAAQHILSIITPAKWISVEEKPEYNKQLLFTIKKNGEVRFGKFYKTDSFGRPEIFICQQGAHFELAEVDKYQYVTPPQTPEKR